MSETKTIRHIKEKYSKDSELKRNGAGRHLFNQKVSIGNPIGNLYRKNHVLILIKTADNNYILGKKEGFYPDHIARFVGGGVDKDEKPLNAAVRELNEELQIVRDSSKLVHLVEICTEAETSEGKMQMITNVYFTKLKKHEKYSANDDLSSLLEIGREEFVDLIKAMENLNTEFVTDKFSFKWTDWAKIYSPIHKIALEIEIQNKYD